MLSTLFAVDFRLAGGPKAFIFQLENFLWFAAEAGAMFALFLIIPGGNYKSASFGTLLYALHPVTADTVNYPLQRGTIIAAFSVVAGLAIWIAWPRLLPKTVPIRLKRVPQRGLDEFLRQNFKKINSLYLKIIHAPLGLYLIPVVLGLLAEPATAVFAPILLVYILLFETSLRPARAIPAFAICISYWIFQLIFTWRLGAYGRPSPLQYWMTQPWVAMRYLYAFVLPFHLSADSDLQPLPHLWSPAVLAGFAGVAALVALAVFTSRRPEWRAVSFGIWWFLIALLPDALIPQRAVEANWRMFLPFVGLALAVARAGWIAIERLARRKARFPAPIFAGSLALALLILCGSGTYRRNAVWADEGTLWRNVVQNSPANGRAFMEYGLSPEAVANSKDTYDYLSRARDLSPHDPFIDINLAQVYERISQPADAERAFRKAISDNPSWSSAYSSYAQWLNQHQRSSEAFQMASKAIEVDKYDLLGRRTQMDILATRHDWNGLKRIALETSQLYPGEPDSEHSLVLAQIGFEKLARAEDAAVSEPSAHNYLILSVLYFEQQRYEDCIRAARKALQLEPNAAAAYGNIAIAYHMMSKLDEAIEAFREQVRINPNLPSAQSSLQQELDNKARLTIPVAAQR